MKGVEFNKLFDTSWLCWLQFIFYFRNKCCYYMKRWVRKHWLVFFILDLD